MHLDETDDISMSHHFDTRLATRDPRLNIADAYLFDAAPDRTVMVMTCSGDAALSAPTAFHPAALYEFRFDTTGDGLDDTGFQVRFIDPVERAENGQRQEFTMHYVTDDDLAVDPAQRVAGKPMFSAELNSPGGSARSTVSPVWSATCGPPTRSPCRPCSTRSTSTGASKKPHTRIGVSPFARRNVMAIVLEVPNALIGDGQVTMWSSISLYGHSVTAQVSRFGIPLFTQLFLSSWRQPLIERYNQVGPLRDFELFAEPVRRFVAEFSALAGLGRISEPYAAGIAAQLIPTVLSYTMGSAAMFTTETINGRPLGADAFDVMVSLAAGRSLGDGVAPDVSRLIDYFPYFGPPYSAVEQQGLLPMPRRGIAL